MIPYVRYLADGEFPEDQKKVREIKRDVSCFTMIDRYLFRQGYSRPSKY